MLPPLLNFRYGENRRINFGLGDGFSVWVLIAIALVTCTAVLIWAARRTLRPVALISVGLLVGGALGNVIDRLRFDRVIDFIDIHLLGYHWPAFNIADSAIFIGVVAWLYGIMSAPKSEGDTHA